VDKARGLVHKRSATTILINILHRPSTTAWKIR
jgi:hypothetical protein